MVGIHVTIYSIHGSYPLASGNQTWLAGKSSIDSMFEALFEARIGQNSIATMRIWNGNGCPIIGSL